MTPISAIASQASTSISSQISYLRRSDQRAAISGRVYRSITRLRLWSAPRTSKKNFYPLIRAPADVPRAGYTPARSFLERTLVDAGANLASVGVEPNSARLQK